MLRGITMSDSQSHNATLKPLEALVANTCFCKLKNSCDDKNGAQCMRERNIYAEFMAQKRSE